MQMRKNLGQGKNLGAEEANRLRTRERIFAIHGSGIDPRESSGETQVCTSLEEFALLRREARLPEKQNTMNPKSSHLTEARIESSGETIYDSHVTQKTRRAKLQAAVSSWVVEMKCYLMRHLLATLSTKETVAATIDESLRGNVGTVCVDEFEVSDFQTPSAM